MDNTGSYYYSNSHHHRTIISPLEGSSSLRRTAEVSASSSFRTNDQLFGSMLHSPHNQFRPLMQESPSLFAQTMREEDEKFYATFPAARQAVNHWAHDDSHGGYFQGSGFHYNSAEDTTGYAATVTAAYPASSDLCAPLSDSQFLSVVVSLGGSSESALSVASAPSDGQYDYPPSVDSPSDAYADGHSSSQPGWRTNGHTDHSPPAQLVNVRFESLRRTAITHLPHSRSGPSPRIRPPWRKFRATSSCLPSDRMPSSRPRFGGGSSPSSCTLHTRPRHRTWTTCLPRPPPTASTRPHPLHLPTIWPLRRSGHQRSSPRGSTPPACGVPRILATMPRCRQGTGPPPRRSPKRPCLRPHPATLSLAFPNRPTSRSRPNRRSTPPVASTPCIARSAIVHMHTHIPIPTTTQAWSSTPCDQAAGQHAVRLPPDYLCGSARCRPSARLRKSRPWLAFSVGGERSHVGLPCRAARTRRAINASVARLSASIHSRVDGACGRKNRLSTSTPMALR